MMQNYKLFVFLLYMTIVFSACNSNTSNETFPTDTNDTVNCAADGPGCKQLNEELIK